MTNIKTGDALLNMPNGKLLLEISERVESAIKTMVNAEDGSNDTLGFKDKLTQTELRVLELDKLSLDDFTKFEHPEAYAYAGNLSNKIDYILESSKKVE